MVSRDIRSLIANNSDVFLGREPTEPDNCVTIYDIGGPPQNARLALNEDYIQVRVRNNSYEAGYERMVEIRKELEGKRENVTLNGNLYIGFWLRSAIMFLMRDEQDRSIFTMEIRVMWHPSDSNKGNREDIT